MNIELDFSGPALRDAALHGHAQHYAREIQLVRNGLLALHKTEVTGDDASDVADRLGLPSGERRWLGGVFRGWDYVQMTDRTVVSRIPRRHARRIAVWATKEGL